jgi:hypothetical protein
MRKTRQQLTEDLDRLQNNYKALSMAYASTRNDIQELRSLIGESINSSIATRKIVEVLLPSLPIERRIWALENPFKFEVGQLVNGLLIVKREVTSCNGTLHNFYTCFNKAKSETVGIPEDKVENYKK